MTQTLKNLGSSRIIAFCFLVILLFSGCDGTQEVWKSAYHASYEQAYRVSRDASRARAKKEGEAQGVDEARHAVSSGHAWQLYAGFAYWTLIPGIVAGVFFQYLILFNCRLNERLPSPAWFAFVPAMKTSMCYRVFNQRFQLMVDYDEQLHKLLASHSLELARLKAARHAAQRRLKSASSIQEVAAVRMVEIAGKQFTDIVADAETANVVEKQRRSDVPGPKVIGKCPHCGKRIQFPQKAANSVTRCPHDKCGQRIRLSSLA